MKRHVFGFGSYRCYAWVTAHKQNKEETPMKKSIKDYQVINHGMDHEQYFQGCGIVHTKFNHVVTGAGETAKEAYEDAVEQLASQGYDVRGVPTKPRGIRKTDKIPSDAPDEIFWYVSICVKA